MERCGVEDYEWKKDDEEMPNASVSARTEPFWQTDSRYSYMELRNKDQQHGPELVIPKQILCPKGPIKPKPLKVESLHRNRYFIALYGSSPHLRSKQH